MSESQLKRLYALNERLREEEQLSRIPASEACRLIVDYVKNTPDPFISAEANQNNPYLKKGKSMCSII